MQRRKIKSYQHPIYKPTIQPNIDQAENVLDIKTKMSIKQASRKK